MKRFVFRILLVVFLLFIVGDSKGQLGDILKKIPKKIPGLDGILKREPAITTSYKDAVYCVPFLDDFNPKKFKSIDSLERTSEGYYIFIPGLYRFDVQSFCLKAATFAPRDRKKGDGYLYAPTKGPRADIVKNIIKRSIDHPEIKQGDIQVLLWAIISYTKLSDMSRDKQITAAKLLTPKEMLEINDGALGLIPENLLDRAFDKLPSEVSQVLRAEAKLRNMLTKTHATYEELERIAVLSGNPPEDEEEDVPYARWSLRPEGFFIRYFPHGYSKTTIEIYVPEIFRLEFDEHGRITLIADENGNSIETTYDNSIEPIVVDDEHSLLGFAFNSICFEHLSASEKEEKLKAEWKQLGWTLVGIPTGKKLIDRPSQSRFSGLKERYEWAKKHKTQLEELDKQFETQGYMDIIMNLGHYSIALKEVLDLQETMNIEWAYEHLDLVKKAWQFAVWLREMYTDKDEESGYEYFGNDAVHRWKTDKQRLAMKLFVYKMNWHKIPGGEYLFRTKQWQSMFRRGPMCITGVVR